MFRSRNHFAEVKYHFAEAKYHVAEAKGNALTLHLYLNPQSLNSVKFNLRLAILNSIPFNPYFYPLNNVLFTTPILLTPQQILEEYWQHSSFRGNQEAIIGAVIAKQDVLALLPTGGGKSICFQVPAMMQQGVCIVISPLIALMKDQVENLNNKGISAISLNASLSPKEVEDILRDVVEGQYKFLYLSPERLETNLFKSYLPQMDCCLIAVDEAHCVSQWGYDFRQPYLRIAEIRNELKRVPIIALTASATPLVQTDIVDKLKLRTPAIFRQSFERPNLSYSVFKVDSKINKAVEILTNVPGSSIIYVRSRFQTQEIVQLLSVNKIAADYYHAGLMQDDRNRKQQDWIDNKIRVMVCTNAFGMGIDKPDVRTVLHFDIPDCLESYYQEAGRAGRDGKKSYAVLLYEDNDMRKLKGLPDIRFPSMEKLAAVYQALANFLDIPVGVGEGRYYDFDINTFTTNFKLNSQLVVATLKVLEQEGHLAFSETVFIPSKVVFTATKEVMNELEFTHPPLDLLSKALLRGYAGIYDTVVSISEKKIARTMRTKEALVHEKLLQLQAFGIIHYQPQKETPQIHFILNRAPAKYIHINQQAYSNRKKLFQDRIDTMATYVETDTSCRSQYVAAYFGDAEARACGVCDNCLLKKRKSTIVADVASMETEIYKHLDTKDNTVKGLLDKIPVEKRSKLWEVLQILQDQKKIRIDDRGTINKTT